MTRTRGHAARLGRTRRAKAASVVPVALLSVAACGSGADTEEATEAETWAEDVCVAVTQWQDELATARATLTDTANLSAATLEDAIAGATEATEDLAGDLSGLGTPETEAGSRAREEISSLSAALDEQRQVLADAADAPATGLDERRDQVSAAVGALRTMVNQTQQTVQQLRSLDGAEELSDAFADAPGCDEVR